MSTHPPGHRLRKAGAALAAIATSTMITLTTASQPAQAAAPHEPFACTTSTAFFPLGAGGLTQVYTGVYGAGELTFSALGTPTHLWNATGYNPEDGYLYGYQKDGGRLLQIGADGSVVDLGAVSPNFGTFNGGDFDDAGTFWVSRPANDSLIGIDVDTRTAQELQLSAPVEASDIVHAHGYMWSVNRSTFDLQRIDMATGTIMQIPMQGIPSDSVIGAAFAYGNGDLGFLAQSAQILYRVKLSAADSANPSATVIAAQSAPPASGADGAACIGAPTDLAVTVQAPEAVPPGQPIDYTLTVSNEGTTDSSGWTLTSELPGNLSNATTSTPGCTITSGLLACTGGILTAGGSVVLTMTGGAPGDGVVITPATVNSNEADSNPANDNDSAQTQIVPDAGAPMASGEALGAVGATAALLFGVGLWIRRRRREVTA